MLSLRQYAAISDRHHHDYYQIVLPRRGVLDLDVMGRGGLVDATQGAFIPVGARHAFQATGDNRFVVLDVDVDTMGSSKAADRLSRQVYVPLSPRLRHLLAFLADVPHGGDLAEGLVESWTSLVLATIVDDDEAGRAPDGRLQKALRFIERHYADRLTVADMAAAAGLSESRLYALFRAKLQTSPVTYLAEYRLDQALHLLTETTLPIAEVAVRTGHYDQSALTRRLKASRFLTPASVRRS